MTEYVRAAMLAVYAAGVAVLFICTCMARGSRTDLPPVLMITFTVTALGLYVISA